MAQSHSAGHPQPTTDLTTQVFLAYAAADQPGDLTPVPIYGEPGVLGPSQVALAIAALRQLFAQAAITYWECSYPWLTTTDVEATISRATEACENYVLVLSPRSLADACCLQGLLFALSMNKRIVPLLAETVPTDQLPEPLQTLDPIDLRFTTVPLAQSQAGQQLLQVLHHDADYHQAHTQLMVKALRWERQQRDPALLLQREDLVKFQPWLAIANGRSRYRPLQLQTLYVAESARYVAAETAMPQGMSWLKRWLE